MGSTESTLSEKTQLTGGEEDDKPLELSMVKVAGWAPIFSTSSGKAEPSSHCLVPRVESGATVLLARSASI